MGIGVGGRNFRQSMNKGWGATGSMCMNKLLDVAEQWKVEYRKVRSICTLQWGSGPHLRSWEPMKGFNQCGNMNRSQIVFRKFLKCLSNASVKEKIHYRHNQLSIPLQFSNNDQQCLNSLRFFKDIVFELPFIIF